MRHLVEETYEVLDAIEQVDPDTGAGYEHLEEELGDLFFQVVFHATLATEAGQFTLADVAQTVRDKLYHRHPHVFGDVVVDGPDDVVRNWEQIKKAEKGRDSVFDGIPSSLPSLLLTLKIQRKAYPLAEQGVVLPITPSIGESVVAMEAAPDADTVGSLLFAITDLAHRADVDPEHALRAYTSRYRETVSEREASTD
jgi:MazG family protein